jgi:hypothetical protein
MNSQLPAERLDELRRAIHSHLKRGNVYDQVRSFVREFVKEREASAGSVISEDELVRVLHEKDVVRSVLRGLSTSPSYPSVRAVSAAASGQSGRMLHVRVCSARAFADLTDEEALSGCTFQVCRPRARSQLCCSSLTLPRRFIAVSTVSAGAAALLAHQATLQLTTACCSPSLTLLIPYCSPTL